MRSICFADTSLTTETVMYETKLKALVCTKALLHILTDPIVRECLIALIAKLETETKQ